MQVQNTSFFYTNFSNAKQENTALKEEDKSLNSSQSSDLTEEKNSNDSTQLSEDEKRVLMQLQSTDTQVKAHEMAHMSAGGGLTTGASYTYTKGPDNKMYAIAGEVGISTREGNTPEESLNIARQIRSAALAPANPSPQDHKVAASAMRMEIEARAQMLKQQAEQNTQNQESKDTNSSEDVSSNEGTSLSQDTNSSTNNAFKMKVAEIYRENLPKNELNFSMAS